MSWFPNAFPEAPASVPEDDGPELCAARPAESTRYHRVPGRPCVPGPGTLAVQESAWIYER